MEFGIEKYAMVTMRRGKEQMSQEIENYKIKKNVRKLGEKETYNYFEISEEDSMK